MLWRRREPVPLGRHGEDLAAKYLKRAGYRILERNVRLGRYEVDIIARDGGTLCFVEVRTRATNDPVPPEDTIRDQKRRHLREAARYYMTKHPDPDQYYRFDVVAVIVPDTGKPEIALYKDAFSG